MILRGEKWEYGDIAKLLGITLYDTKHVSVKYSDFRGKIVREKKESQK